MRYESELTATKRFGKIIVPGWPLSRNEIVEHVNPGVCFPLL